MKLSAGTLLYRRSEGALEVLLVHPSGNYNRHKPWSIPKGLPDEGESLEDAARALTIAWREDYSRHRPHSSLDYQTLTQFAAACAASAPDAPALQQYKRRQEDVPLPQPTPS